MANPVLIPIEDVEITLTFPDGSTEPFTLEAPNSDGEDIFFIDFVRLPILANYPGADYTMQRGHYKYQFQAQYSYADHQMNLFRLIAASNIELKVPPEFGDTDNYQTYDVLLENRRGIRNYLNGLAMAVPDQTNQEDANLIPAGSVTLNFIGKKPFNEQEMLGSGSWFSPGDVASDMFLHVDPSQESFELGTQVNPNDYSGNGFDFENGVGVDFNESQGHRYFQHDNAVRANTLNVDQTDSVAHLFCVCQLLEEPNNTAWNMVIRREIEENNYNAIGAAGTAYNTSKENPVWAVWYGGSDIFETERVMDTSEVVLVELLINGANSYIRFNNENELSFSGTFSSAIDGFELGFTGDWTKQCRVYEAIWYDRVLNSGEINGTRNALLNKYSGLI